MDAEYYLRAVARAQRAILLATSMLGRGEKQIEEFRRYKEKVARLDRLRQESDYLDEQVEAFHARMMRAGELQPTITALVRVLASKMGVAIPKDDDTASRGWRREITPKQKDIVLAYLREVESGTFDELYSNFSRILRERVVEIITPAICGADPEYINLLEKKDENAKATRQTQSDLMEVGLRKSILAEMTAANTILRKRRGSARRCVGWSNDVSEVDADRMVPKLASLDKWLMLADSDIPGWLRGHAMRANFLPGDAKKFKSYLTPEANRAIKTLSRKPA
jgi:hypothetical protein